MFIGHAQLKPYTQDIGLGHVDKGGKERDLRGILRPEIDHLLERRDEFRAAIRVTTVIE